MRISLPAYRKPAPGCGRTSITAKKTFYSRPRPRRGWSVIRIGQSQDGHLLRLKRSTGRVPGAALESLPPDEQQNDSDDQLCQAEHRQCDHGRVQDAGIRLHIRISVSIVIGRQDISHIHIHSVFHVIRQFDVHCIC